MKYPNNTFCIGNVQGDENALRTASKTMVPSQNDTLQSPFRFITNLSYICGRINTEMSSQSAYNKIKTKIESFRRGKLFFPDDFASLASSDAVRSALVRLCRSGIIIRVAQGIYYYPKADNKWGRGVILPSVEEIAESIAKRDKIRIAPTGTYVLNQLGLSTQIPANVVFVTDGSGRRVSIGKGKGILFKHSSEMRNFSYRSHLMLLIVTALREIGENHLTAAQADILSRHLSQVEEKDFQKDIQLAPLWVRKTLHNL